MSSRRKSGRVYLMLKYFGHYKCQVWSASAFALSDNSLKPFWTMLFELQSASDLMPRVSDTILDAVAFFVDLEYSALFVCLISYAENFCTL